MTAAPRTDDRDREEAAAWLASVARAIRKGDIPPYVLTEAVIHYDGDGMSYRTEVMLDLNDTERTRVDSLPSCIPQSDSVLPIGYSMGMPDVASVTDTDTDTDDDDDEEDEADEGPDAWQQAFMGMQRTANALTGVAAMMWPWIVFAAGWPITVGWMVEREYDTRYRDPEDEDYLMTTLFGGLLWIAFWLVVATAAGAMLHAAGLWVVP